ncbi:hypothetical protein OF117_03530 [Geodermatophilus sp. YIM 151500]|uniref:hypothetical protein n=1 Tax=Geodermatophilus sp. YIM 151500 TaxID=2984531 RepID=UPI0021E3F9FB|nr:hypothetical protein [Geodermatophilus sp. YIM 151500]MCV2488423.1 hypothetical protein [Geodermatophilus sp. YIM 151500]
MTALTVAAVFAITSLMQVLVLPHLSGWPMPLRLLVSAMVVVLLLGHVVMPGLTRLFSGWLHPPPLSARAVGPRARGRTVDVVQRSGAAGWLLVLLLLASVVVAHGLTCTAVPRGGGHAAAHLAAAHAPAAHDAVLHAASLSADDDPGELLPSGSPPTGTQGSAVVAVCLVALLAVGVRCALRAAVRWRRGPPSPDRARPVVPTSRARCLLPSVPSLAQLCLLRL